jgi:hypothetical protein
VHPVQLHIKDLIQEILDSGVDETERNPLHSEWCDCEDFRQRLRNELHDLGFDRPLEDQ